MPKVSRSGYVRIEDKKPHPIKSVALKTTGKDCISGLDIYVEENGSNFRLITQKKH